MNTNPIVIGMIGAGFSATFHVHNYRLVPGLDVQIKGVTARSQESATAFAQEHNIEQFIHSGSSLCGRGNNCRRSLCPQLPTLSIDPSGS